MTFQRFSVLSIPVAVLCLATAGPAAAQLVNYSEALGAYKDSREAGIKLVDGVTPGVTAKARVARALEQNRVVDQQALVQPDGTLLLPSNQTNLVIRTNYNNVQQGADGQVRIASPTIQGNVSGNVTLFVDGKGVENITVLNNGR
ncbi:hypothetical protein [Variovorax sp. PAMC 28711]|uniref:hypothetical protein n=1 Tax=Variovorax sp. PAMC 28711 TaxID=1795631 RepID=UPI00078B3099|nr:hypothetical protein [Variovorax sp. PAMC 28711]AMM24592.1 hypothetical protein AX767_09710 [Variovorax sp. PAMC 28711]